MQHQANAGVNVQRKGSLDLPPDSVAQTTGSRSRASGWAQPNLDAMVVAPRLKLKCYSTFATSEGLPTGLPSFSALFL